MEATLAFRARFNHLFLLSGDEGRIARSVLDWIQLLAA